MWIFVLMLVLSIAAYVQSIVTELKLKWYHPLVLLPIISVGLYIALAYAMLTTPIQSVEMVDMYEDYDHENYCKQQFNLCMHEIDEACVQYNVDGCYEYQELM